MNKRLLFTAVLLIHFIANAQEIGVQLYSFRNQIPKDIPGTLKKIREMGIKELEGGGTYGLPLADYKKIIDDNGFKMVCVGASFDTPKSEAAVLVRENRR